MFYAAVIILLFLGPIPATWQVGIITDTAGPYSSLERCERILEKVMEVAAALPVRHITMRAACDSLEEWEIYARRNPWEVEGKDI